MQIASVVWKNRVPTKGIDAKTAYESLEQIRAENDGVLTDDYIVERAKPKDSPLHVFFEWDNKKAAIEHRRAQARLLMRSFEVTYVESPELKTRAYEIMTRTPSGGEERTTYAATVEVMSAEDSRDKLIAEAIRMAMEFRRRFKHLHELDAILEAIEKTIEKIVE